MFMFLLENPRNERQALGGASASPEMTCSWYEMSPFLLIRRSFQLFVHNCILTLLGYGSTKLFFHSQVPLVVSVNLFCVKKCAIIQVSLPYMMGKISSFLLYHSFHIIPGFM